jgi:hypothetical protein
VGRVATGDITFRLDLTDVTGLLQTVLASLASLHLKVDRLMATQAEIDQIAADVTAIRDVLTGFIPRVEAEIQALKDANPTLNMSALEGLVAEAKAKSAELDAIPTPDAPAGP